MRSGGLELGAEITERVLLHLTPAERCVRFSSLEQLPHSSARPASALLLSCLLTCP